MTIPTDGRPRSNAGPVGAPSPAPGVDVPTLFARSWRGLVRMAVLLVDDVPTADHDLELAETERAVLAAVRTLPRRQQEVLVLRFWSELSEAEIATALGVSPGTVKSSASRAMARLRRVLEGAR